MMGIPAGWVTDVPGLTPNEQLKLLGNGVVPQQAALALRLLGVAAEAAAPCLSLWDCPACCGDDDDCPCRTPSDHAPSSSSRPTHSGSAGSEEETNG